jgi:hypothetical protein
MLSGRPITKPTHWRASNNLNRASASMAQLARVRVCSPDESGDVAAAEWVGAV